MFLNILTSNQKEKEEKNVSNIFKFNILAKNVHLKFKKIDVEQWTSESSKTSRKVTFSC